MPTQFDLGAMLNAKPANAQYEAAAALNAQILTCARTAQENLYQMAMGFKKCLTNFKKNFKAFVGTNCFLSLTGV